MTRKICYCFNHTEQDIRSDVLAHGGESRILEQILASKGQRKCQCPIKHPEGR